MGEKIRLPAVTTPATSEELKKYRGKSSRSNSCW
jgi:hypothetical protein